MKNRIFAFVLIVLIFVSGCKKIEAEQHVDLSTEATSSTEQTETLDVERNVLLQENDEITDDTEKEVISIEEANREKPVYTPEQRPIIPSMNERSKSGTLEEQEETLIEYIKENVCADDDNISNKTYVYEEEFLYNNAVPNCDYGRWRGKNIIKTTYAYLNSFPTEAIKEADDGMLCIIHDVDTGMRVFSWHNEYFGVYQFYGYPIYMAETLSYSNFSDIAIGDDVSAVEDIDPKVVEIHLRLYRENEEPQHTLNRIDNGYPPRSLHLLTDGLLVITYGRDGDNFPITDIEFHEDFTIDTVAGPQCCKIDPLDYVTQG